MAADFASIYSYGGPGAAGVNILPVTFANGQTVGFPRGPLRITPDGPGATVPAGSQLPVVASIPTAGRNPYSTVQPASVTSAAALAAAQVAAQAAAAPAVPAAAAASWLDESTLTSHFTNGQVVGAAALLLGLIYLTKRR